MPLDWLGGPKGLGVSLNDLISRKKYAKAIALLRAQFRGRAPGAQVRLQLVDLLVLAGRSEEAIPILIPLADEFAAEGFAAKAVAILKRVEKIRPGLPEVEQRLTSLIRHQPVAALTPSPRVAMPEFGIEEVDPATLETLEVEEDTPSQPAGEEPSAEIALADEAPATVGGPSLEEIIDSIPESLLSEEPPPEVPPETTEEAALEAGAPLPGESKIRGALKRFLASLPEMEEREASQAEELTEPAPSHETAPAPEEAKAVIGVGGRLRGVFRRLLGSLREKGRKDESPGAGVSESIDPSAEGTESIEGAPEILPALLEPESASAVAEGSESAEPLEAAPGGSGRPEPFGAALSDEAFEAQLLDFIEELCQPSTDGPTLAELVARAPAPSPHSLVASPLFAGLSDEELLAIVQGLQLHVAEPGDIILTEGEVGDNIFILAAGTVKIFVRNPDGRNFAVNELHEGSFFGEISTLTGRPRNATVTAASQCELLDLDRFTLDSLADIHPGIREVLAASYLERTGSAEAAAVRGMPRIDAATQQRSMEILEAHFGESRWDPRVRLRLADALAKAGKFSDAVTVLVGLADDLATQGFPEKAIAILKKVERMKGHLREFNLAPLKPKSPPAPSPSRRKAELTETFFEDWVVELARDTVARHQAPLKVVGNPRALSAYGPGLRASPLFEGFSEEELVALIRGLRLLTASPGDILVTEGERSEGVFILTTGSVKVFVRNPGGHDVGLCILGEGSFFGEMATLTGSARCATVVAAARCELLELDRAALDTITRSHPRVRDVLEAYAAARSKSSEVASIRSLNFGRGSA
jgi:CRP-like cAMP-binding protein